MAAIRVLSGLFNASQFPCASPVLASVGPNTTFPEALTPCLVSVILPAVVALLAIGCLAFLIFYGQVILAPILQRTPLLLAKGAFSLLAVSAGILRLGLTDSADLTGDPEPVVSRLLALIFSGTAFCCFLRCWRRGIVSSIWLHLVWFLRFCVLILQCVLIRSYYKPNLAEFWVTVVETMAALALVIAYCFADKFPTGYEVLIHGVKKLCPDRYSSTVSRLMFSYASELTKNGYQTTLDYDSFWTLDTRNQPERIINIYKSHLPSLATRKQSNSLWLFVALLKCTKFNMSAAFALTMLFACAMLADPIMLKLVVDSVTLNYPIWYATLFVVIGTVGSMGRFCLSARCDLYGLLCYLDVQTVLMNAIFEKVLKMCPQSKIQYSAGEVVNLLATDVERIRNFWFNLLDFFYAPTMIIITAMALYLTIGHNLLYGMLAIILSIPVNSVVMYYATNFENNQMKFKDERLKLMTDILSGLKVVKLYAWETSMRKRVAAIRAKEVSQYRNAIICYSSLDTTFNICPILATIVAFVGYLFVDGHQLTPQVAFVTLMLFNLMRYSIYRLPGLVREIINARISLKRLQDFLNEDELQPIANNILPSTPSAVVELKDAAFTWDKNSELPPTIRNLNFTLQRGELVGVIGRVGTGKSSLLSAVCGELQLASGGFFRAAPLSLAYVPQEHWIQNMTFRDNVLFGRAFDEVYYRRTLDACALREDLRLFVAGDATEIGERGLNLSGGQKARVALARAVYQRADLYVLDDTLSAVDSHVGAHIFEHVIGSEGLLGRTTRLFALNSLSYLSRCDRILVLQEGEIVDAGTYPELCARKHDAFVELVRELATRQESMKDEPPNAPAEGDDVLSELVGSPPAGIAATIVRRRTMSTSSEPPTTIRQVSVASSTHSHAFSADVHDGRLVEDEELAAGKSSWKNYTDYIKAFGVRLFVFYVCCMFGLRTSLESASQVWMANWSGERANATISDKEGLVVYGVLGIVSSIVVGLTSSLTAFGAFRASKVLHDNLLFSLLRSPMKFFDVTPMGRILNRVSRDIERIDGEFPQYVAFVFVLMADVIFYVMAAIIVLPLIGIFVVPLIVGFVLLVRYYTYTSVQIRRLCSKAWSCVTTSTQESYSGVTIIRSFGHQERFLSRNLQVGKTAVESNLGEIIANRWIQLRMDFLTAIVCACFSLAAILLGHANAIGAGTVALVLSTGTMLRGVLGEIARSTKNVEMTVVSVERVQEYIENEPEAEWEGEERAPPDWPTRGEIRFEDVSLRYRPTTPLVLHNLNVTIAAGQKVGIVGRTGAGKSSLTLALFRLVEPAGGRILIDGLDCGRLGLHEVRRALTIIPQDPVLFCGDLRANLDPFEELSDADLWQAVERAHLLPFVQQFPNGLRHEIGEGGSNLSVGQRQLVCLARAILRRDTRILVLDEATAAVDLETDRLIQRAIRNEFVHATVLTIAHRLDTILDYDRVLVLEAGEVREFDTPQTLLRNPEGLFHSLAKQAKLI